MSKTSAMKKTEGLVGGGILMLIGMLFLLDRLDLYEFRRVWTWWPLLLIALGALMTWQALAQNSDRGDGRNREQQAGSERVEVSREG